MLETVRWITAEGRILDAPATDTALLPGKVRLIDQTRLPEDLVYLVTDDPEVLYDAIRRLAVRGAPAIGCAAALGLAAATQHIPATEPGVFLAEVRAVADRLASSRPTAVNLSWALNRCLAVLEGAADQAPARLKDRLAREALEILAEDIRMCRAIGTHGEALIGDGGGVLTHCNAGALATGDYGTALSVMYAAHEAGRAFTVFADETRPLFQGSRLTAWELHHAGIDVTTICDGMAGLLMQEGRVNLVIVGADRIAGNGDTANKIGTYGVAVLARHHEIPFYVAAPYSTIDPAIPDGRAIPIEERDPDEIRRYGSRQTAPPDAAVYNPAFDVTPHELITAFVTDQGIIHPPYGGQLTRLATTRRGQL